MTNIDYFDVALRLAGFCFKKQDLELITELHELVETNPDARLTDVSKIIADNKTKHEGKKC